MLLGTVVPNDAATLGACWRCRRGRSRALGLAGLRKVIRENGTG